MTHLSLFAGIGGIDLGLSRAGSRCVGMVEIDPFCRAVLAKNFPGVPLFQDVRSFDARPFAGSVDLVAGGFPCQDISVAGKGAGIDGARSGLWTEMLRVVREVRPAWVLAENVPALRTRGADRVLGDLEGEGYACWPLLVGAGDVGAPHRRQRVWIVAHRARDGQRGQRSAERADGLRIGPGGDAGVADADGRRCGSRVGDVREGQPDASGGDRREALADANSGTLRLEPGRRAGAGGSGAAELAGGGETQCAFCGYPFDHDALGKYGCPNCCGEGLGDADGAGLGEPRGPFAVPPQQPAAERAGCCGGTWPARPGQPQHEWEAARLVELPLGGTVDGIPARLVRTANRHALRAFGNSVVPQVVELVGRVIVAAHAEREGRAVA